MTQPTMTDAKPSGPALAALLSAGIGVAALGVLTTLAEASKPISDALVISKPVGPLSGKTTYAVTVWLLAWIVLAFLWRGKRLEGRPVYIATFILIAMGLIGTFPLFFDLFAR